MGVEFPEFVEITISPTTATVWDDSWIQFTAYALYDDGHSSPLTPQEAFWSSSDETVATVTNTTFNGRVFGVNPGTCTITVHLINHPHTDPYLADAALTVTVPPPPPPPPEARFSLGFGAGVLDPYPTWTPIDTNPNLVTNYSIDRGRSYELDQTDAGRATVQILDPDGTLDPTNPAGPHYGQIRPLLHAVICRHNPVTDTWEERFRGYVEDYEYDIHPSQQVNQLTLTLVDLFEIASSAEMQPGQFGTNTGDPVADAEEGEVSYPAGTPNARIAAIASDLGLPRNRYMTLPGAVTLRATRYSAGESALSAIQEAADSEFPNVANVYCDRHGRLVFHGRTARFDPNGTAAAAGGAWDYHHFKAGDGTAVAASPSDTAQVRALGFTRGLSKIINTATALELGVPDDQVTSRRVTDAASINTYGIRSWSVSNLITQAGDLDATYPTNAATETHRFAAFYVANYAQPRDRINSIEFRSLHPDDPRAPANWQLLSQVDVGDTITVTVATAGGGGFNAEEYFVEGVHETAEPLTGAYDNVTVTLDLSPRSYYTVNPWATPLAAAVPATPTTKNPVPRSGKPKPAAHGGDHGHDGSDPIRHDAEDVGTGIEDGGGVAALQIADEGTILADQPVLNFTGAGVTAAPDFGGAPRNNVNIPAGIRYGIDNTGNWVHVETTTAATDGVGIRLNSNAAGTAGVRIQAAPAAGLEVHGVTAGITATTDSYSGTALAASTPVAGDAIHAYTGNGVGINVHAVEGQALIVDCGAGAAALTVSVNGAERFRIDSTGTHFNGGFNTDSLNIEGLATQIGDFYISGHLYINGTEVIP